MENSIALIAALFGLLVGSFLNALIYRLPRNINIALPRSSCTNCKKVITWYENIPVFSFLFLKARCSGCHARISWQYPFVEILTSVFAYLVAPKTIHHVELLNFFFFFSIFCAFLVHFIIDIKHQVLPDAINIYLAMLFLVVSVFSRSWSFWLIGGFLGLGFPLLVSWIFYMIRGQVGLGGGDIKLYAAIGIYLGPIGIMQNIFLSCFLGALTGVILILLKILKRDQPIPFGPFILIIASLQIFSSDWFTHLISYIP